MSIDALIQAHIEALNTNTKAVELLTLSLAGRTPKAEKKNAEVIDAVVKEITKEDPIAKKLEVQEVVEKIDTDFDESKLEPTPYETLRALVLKIAPTNREGIKAVSAKHGISAPKDLLKDPQDYSSVTDQAKLEAVYADLQALEA